MKDNKTLNKILTDETLKNFEAKAEELATEVAKIKADGDEGTFKFIISTGNEDRQGERVIQDGIDIKNFMKNPVLLVDHRYTIDSIAGKFTKITRDGDKTIGEGVFSSNATGEHAKALYDGGFLNAVSVGFRALAYDEEDRSNITKSELLEVSLVAVPANAEALAMLDSKAIAKAGANGLLTFKQEVAQEDAEDVSEDTPAEDEVVTPVDEKGDKVTVEKLAERMGVVEDTLGSISTDIKGLTDTISEVLAKKKTDEVEEEVTPAEDDEDEVDLDNPDMSEAEKALAIKRELQKGVGYLQELLSKTPYLNVKTAEEVDEDEEDEDESDDEE